MSDTPDRGTQALLEADSVVIDGEEHNIGTELTPTMFAPSDGEVSADFQADMEYEDSVVIDDESQQIEADLTPTMFPPINNEPAQGIRAQMDLLYLWNPDVAQDLIEKLEEALASVEDGKIRPYEEVMAPIKIYTACTHGDNVYVANSNIEEKPEEFVESQWTLIATKRVPNDGVLTIQKNGVTIATFSANSSEDVVANIEADTQVQSDWAEADEESPAFILNKPVLGALAEKDTVEISEVNGLEDALDGKQDSLSEEQIQAIDSGITKDLVEQITTNEGNISDIQDELEGYGDIVTHNVSEFQPAGDYATTGELNDLADIVDQETKDREQADSNLQDQIDNLAARGRFLALWNAITGLPTSTPQIDPYEYKTGDYYIVGTVGEINYKPSGTKYVVGEPSTEVETEELATDDVYYFDGAVWRLQVNHGKTVSFANLAGQPEDNTELKQALDDKVGFTDYATTTKGGVIKINNASGMRINSYGQLYADVLRNDEYPRYGDNTFVSKGTLENIKESLVTSVGDTKYASKEELATKQDTISDLTTIRSNALAGKNASDTIATYGDIVTHNSSEFATHSDIPTKTSDLENDSGYITDAYHDSTKQDKLTSANAGEGIAITTVEAGNNLLNPNDIAEGNYYVNYGNGSLQAPSSTGGVWVSSGFIKVKPNTAYYFNEINATATNAGSAWFDGNRNYISGFNSTKLRNDGNVETSPANAAYIRHSFRTDTGYNTDWQNTVMINEGTSPIPFEPYVEPTTIISNTRTSAEWGNIGGDIQDQTDLKELFDSKQNKLAKENAGENINITYSGGGSVLPQGYVQYTFMESTGNQVVDAGTVSNGEWVEIVFSPTTISGTVSGSYTGVAGNNNSPQMGYCPGSWTSGNAGSSVPYAPESGRIYTYKWTSSNGRFYIDDVWTNLTRTGILSLNLFQCESASRPTRIYEVRKYNANNELVLHLYPALEDSTFRNGMYDVVNNVFYPSNNSLTPGEKIQGENVIISADLSEVESDISRIDEKIKEIELHKTPNVLIQGEPTINNGQVTNFSKTNYLILPFEFNVGEKGFELTYAFRTGSDVTTAQNLFGSKFSIASYIQNGKLTIRISSNGTSWDILDLITSLNIQANTTYYIKLIFNRLNYTVKSSTDGVEYTQIGSIVDTRPPFAGDVYIGIGNNTNNPFLGMINLHKWELKYNNSVFWEGMDDAGLATRADISLSNLDEQGEARFTSKQDVISDLTTIRSNASTGAGLAPQVAVNTQRIEDLTTAKFPNVVIVGTPHIEGGQVSNYSDTSYLQFPFVDISRGQPFDIYFSFTTSNDVTTQQNILDAHFGIALAIQDGKGIMALSSNGTNWDIGMATGTNTLLPNTTYYVKYSWTGAAYSAALSTNDETYVPDMNLTSSLSPYKTTIFIGGSPNLFGPASAHPFKGTINFNKSKVVVNNITVWEGMADVGLASRANVSLNNLDEVGRAKFDAKQDVISDLNTIRSNASSAKSTVDTHVANTTIHVTAGDKIAWSQKQNKLVAGENIIIDESTNTISATGGADGETIKNQNTDSSIEKTYDWTGTLQEAKDQNVRELHPDWKIFITDDVTGGESVYTKAEVDELLSKKNGGRNIGDIFYTTRNDESLAGAVECNGGTYSTADYEGEGSIGELLASGKLNYISLTDYATAISTKGWCDKIGWNGTGTTSFRVPTLTPHIIQTNNIPVVGNGMVMGMTEGTTDYGVFIDGSTNFKAKTTTVGQPVGNVVSGGTNWSNSKQVGITTDGTKSGIIADTSDTAQLRVMIQLFNSTTDEAVATVGTVVAQVGELRNMSNVTSTGKETVVGWGMPDYTAGVSKTWNTDTTATTDCLVLCRSASNNTASDSLRFYIDGALIGDYVIANSGIFILTFFVSKGHTYKATGTRGSSMLIEYPLKGVN